VVERSTSNRDILFTALAGVKGPTSHGSGECKLTSHESKSIYLTSHEKEESEGNVCPLQVFFSQDRWLSVLVHENFKRRQCWVG
jgi:hypothetical protein